MADDVLRLYELRLLRCTIPSPYASPPPPPTSPPHPLHSLVSEILELIENGRYLEALSIDAVRREFHSFFDDDNYNFELVNLRLDSFLNCFQSDDDDKLKLLVVTCVAVAAALAFIQSNLIGPVDKDMPPCPLLPLKSGWEDRTRLHLMSAGSDLLSKFSNLEMLLMRAKDLLMEVADGMRTISLWLSRVILLQQRVLDERCSSLLDLLQVLMAQTLQHFGTVEWVTDYWGVMLGDGEAHTIVSVLHLEAGIADFVYGRVDSAKLHFTSAEVASGLQLSVTGILGFRTIYQVEPKAQLVLVADKSTSNGGNNCADIQTNATSETCKASDILMTPRLLENNESSSVHAQDSQRVNGGSTVIPLKANQQAVILAQCLLIEKGARQDELQGWDMAPYIEAIDSQRSSCFIIRSLCDILRVRWESTRSRTKERALLMMDKLVQSVYETTPRVTERIHYSFGVYIPTISALRKEHAELLVSCGLIGEAIKVFEDLELWDNLIYCYRLLEKKAAAVELIKKRLSEMPNDPRLWCSLGDVTIDDACYEKALEVSDNRSARAKRSLARSAYNRGDYETSKNLWESAMALNSLYPDGWFALGAAALKARDLDKALDGFTRAVQLDPDNGEAWNNIACFSSQLHWVSVVVGELNFTYTNKAVSEIFKHCWHMIKNKSKESFIAFKEALKFKRDSWQLWENFSHVAVDVGHLGQALEAIQTVLNKTNNKRVDVELLERIMLDLERRALNLQSSRATDNDHNCTDLSSSDTSHSNDTSASDTEMARTKETEHLLEQLGKILQQACICFSKLFSLVRQRLGLTGSTWLCMQQVVRSSGGADMWGLYAKWHKIRGDLMMCSEALLKQVRSYQGSDLWKDPERFRKFARASLELCNVYMEIASSTGNRQVLFTAEMHLRNIIKQAGSFSDTEEFRDIQACLDEVMLKLQSNSVSDS
ncbi:hypothetical protein RJ641_011636 [Dillenia turbinata]|uniref:Uncharacterized protein n=1 Tax=Dillenia turbinata TaxID=194707 RepID=A0AAN8V5X7_9MAGN